MPGTGWSVSFSAAPPWSASDATEHYRTWLFAVGLRDVLEAFGTFLDECYDIASHIGLMRKQKDKGLLIGQDYFDHQADTLKYRRLGVEKKIAKLKTRLITLPADLEESVLSINRARNILTHHDGIVPETYLDTTGHFQVTWKRLTLRAVGTADREVRLGDQLEAGQGIGLRVVAERRDFGRGDRIRLEPVEFAGICWTIFTAGDAIRETLEKQWFQS